MKKLIPIISILLITGCAGSANHDVVGEYQAEDSRLSCGEVDEQIIRTQIIIDEVNKDKDDVSGADIVDGILFFPFNLIAKSNNYDNATKAASKRIARLGKLKEKKGCKDETDEMMTGKTLLAEELKALKKMYRNGDLTKAEYIKMKTMLFTN